ncbi:hypothetical protein LINPERPRIM_LOCUS15478 [Linum perenne]
MLVCWHERDPSDH